MTATVIPTEMLLELSAAAMAMRHRVGRRRSYRIEVAVGRVLFTLRKADLAEALAVPPPWLALEQFQAALRIARAAGVTPPDLVAAFNGD